ncbi:MAG: hypothetical protein JNM86_06815 [Phycisphaerae bacterium]|nr:hypothetical protein [Phycisphaerae bacterium]
MNHQDRHQPDAPPNDAPDFVPPEENAAAESRADELFIHGTLGTLHEQGGDAVDRRIARFKDAIAGTARTPGRRAIRARLQRLAGVAVVLLATLLTAWVFVSASTNQARATLMASIQAARNAGDRRYEVRILTQMDQPIPAKPEAVFDSRGSNFLLRARAPMGHTAIAGKDSLGEWAIRRQGGIERDDPRRAWPQWATADDEPIFADSIDRLLEVLTTGFEVSILDPEIVEGREFRRIQGVKRPGSPRPQADRVDLWIDPETMLLEKMEMTWTERPGPRGPAVRPPLSPPGAAAPRGPRPEGPPPMRGPEHPDRPPPDGPPPERLHDRPGPRGERPMGPPPAQGEPRLGPPGREGGLPPRGPGIRRLIVTRADVPEWPANWFSPEAHEDGSWGEP